MANEAFDYPLLDMSLLNVDRVQRRYAVVEATFGDGYSASALVGSSAGQTTFTLSADVWPDDANLKQIQNKAAFAYYYDFLQDRLRNGNAPFIIYWRGAYYLVQMTEPDLSIDVMTADLFASGLEVRGRRISGIAVRNDSSLIYPPEHPGLYGWWAADLFSDVQGVPDGGTVDEWLARGTSAILTPAGATAPTLKLSQIAGEPAVRLTTSGYKTASDFTSLYALAMVLKFREATFAANRTLVSFGFGGTQILYGASGATKFSDPGISGMTYYLNGVQKTATTMDAPMNTYGIVQCMFATPVTISNMMTIGFRDISGGVEYSPVDIAEILLFRTAITATYRGELFQYLNAKYRIV